MTAPSIPTVFIVSQDDAAALVVMQVAQSCHFLSRRFAAANEMLESLDASQPGCIVLDFELEARSGCAIQGYLKGCGLHTPIIFFARQAAISAVVDAMRAGAVDFLELPDLDSRLGESLRKAIELDAQRRQTRAEQSHTQARLALLTAQERGVADCMAAGLSIKEIAARLDISQRTVHLRQASILEKLELSSTADLLLWMLRDVAGRKN